MNDGVRSESREVVCFNIDHNDRIGTSCTASTVAFLHSVL